MKRISCLLLLSFSLWCGLGAQDDAVSEGRSYAGTFTLPQLTSPEAVWDSFDRVMEQYSKVIIASGYTNHNYDLLNKIEGRMQQFFDMQEVPPSVRRTTAAEASVYLYESFARFRSLPSGTLPDREKAFAEMKEGYPGVWLIGDGVISIVYVDTGEYRGSFQFSARTLSMAEPIFEEVKSLSYVNDEVQGLHDAYFLTPGPLIPSSWVRNMPSWLHKSYFKQGVWQWIALVLVFLSLVFVLSLLSRYLARLSSGWPDLLRVSSRLIIPIASILLTMAAVEFLAVQIFITGDVLRAVRFLEWFIILVSAVFIVFIIGNVISEIIIHTRRFKEKGIDSSLVRFAVKVASIIIAAAVVIEGATMLGFSFTTVLAGAGVTGLAIALAAQESLRNVFGSVMLLLDKPFTVGQRVVIRGHDGIIESIGLRSTKMRQLDGHLTSFPNEDVAKADIENIGERQHIRRLIRIYVSLETSPEKIDEAVNIIRGLLAQKEGEEDNIPVNHPDYPPRVYFESVGEYAFQLIVIYWYHPPDYWGYMAFNERFNRELVQRFRASGIDLAVPARTHYLIDRKSGDVGAIEDLPEAVSEERLDAGPTSAGAGDGLESGESNS